MSDNDSTTSNELLLYARDRGVLSPTSLRALQRPEVVKKIDQALAESYTVDTAGAVLLVTIMPDDSASMKIGTKQADVIAGHKYLLDELKQSDARERILFQTRLLNGRVVNPFSPLSECVDLSEDNYPLPHGTPLYIETIAVLGAVLAKTEELLADGAARVRSATLVMTDGMETVDTAGILMAEVASVIQDMRVVGDHDVAGMGFSSAGDHSPTGVFRGMGIEARLIFDAGSRQEIIDAFLKFSSSKLALTAGPNSGRIFEG